MLAGEAGAPDRIVLARLNLQPGSFVPACDLDSEQASHRHDTPRGGLLTKASPWRTRQDSNL